ncbi:MAG: transporter permease [Xanthobacteraceae bacterium]|jgi:trehalose/maltose transport system permease protein|nr:transporter permease [Xanthobacteraceae bacterium]
MNGQVNQVSRAAMAAPRTVLARSRARAAWMLATPALFVLAAIAGWPLARTVWFSFTDAELSDFARYSFVGFANYLGRFDGEWDGVLADPVWWGALWNTLWFALISVSLETLLGLVFALVLAARFPGRGLLRAVVLIPWAIPTVVSARMWGWMLNDQFGIVNDLLMRLGVIGAPIAWTADAGTALWAVIIVDVWKTTPFMALLILAALEMLPHDLYEAARLDGVRPLELFRRVTLPLIRPALLVAVAFRGLDALRMFDLIYVLTAGGSDTMTISSYARQELVDFQEVGLGSAAATLVFLVVALTTVVFLTANRVRIAAEEVR